MISRAARRTNSNGYPRPRFALPSAPSASRVSAQMQVSSPSGCSFVVRPVAKPNLVDFAYQAKVHSNPFPSKPRTSPSKPRAWPSDSLSQTSLFVQAIQFDTAEIETRNDSHDFVPIDDWDMSIAPVVHRIFWPLFLAGSERGGTDC